MERHGVALEMQVARAFRSKLGESQLVWDVDLGRNYIDHDTNTGAAKLRETDLVVRATKVLHGDVWISVWLAIECKASKAEPWVFYRAAGRIDPWAQTLSETAWEAIIDERLVEPNIGGWSGSSLVMATVRNCYAAASTSDPRQDKTKPNHARTRSGRPSALRAASSATYRPANTCPPRHSSFQWSSQLHRCSPSS